MRRAIELAREGWGQTAPNPMVGAVVVRDGKIVGEGAHIRFGEAHAEVRALEAAGESARGATLYVTLEPCNHHGKTPPCTRVIVAAGVARVVAAMEDPNPIAAGGAEFLRNHGIAVDVGVEREAAGDLTAPFRFTAASTRPFVTLKVALSLEGGMADAARTKKWLTGAAARDEVHRLRADADAIAVGVGTVIADDPELTVRRSITPRRAPTRVVFDRSGRIPTSSKVVQTARAVPTVVVTAPDAGPILSLRAAGVTVIEAASTLAALERLGKVGIRHLLVEGGPGLARELLTAGVVDRLVIFQTRVQLGEGALKPFDRLEGLEIERTVHNARFGDDEMTVYALKSK